jgi:hypothetical protein
LRELILTWVGSKRVIAFYWPDSGNCAVQVVEMKRLNLLNWAASNVWIAI